MFCSNCGKKLPDDAKFCSGCGTPVSPAVPDDADSTPVQPPVEEPVSEPAEPQSPQPAGEAAEGGDVEAPEGQDDAAAAQEGSPAPEVVDVALSHRPIQQPAEPILSGKKHRGKAIGLLAAAAVVAVAVVVGIVMLLSSLGGGKAAYLYATDDHELMFLDSLKEDAESVEITDESALSVSFSPDGKYLYYFEADPDDYSSYADLYRIAVSEISGERDNSQRVSSDVYCYNLHLLENGGVVYLKGDTESSDLHCFDGENSFKLADEVFSFTVDEEEKFAYYSELDPDDTTLTLSRIPLEADGAAEELADGVDSFFSAYDADILLYGEAVDSGDENDYSYLYDIYSLVPGETPERLARDVFDVIGVDTEDGLSFAYLTRETEEHTLYDFVTDSLASQDAAAVEPDLDDFISGVDRWGWNEYDWDAYYAAQEAWWEVSSREYLREELQEMSYDLTSYTLHRYADGTDTVLASGLVSSPMSSVKNDIFLYSKTEQEVSKVVDIADLGYSGEVYDYISTADTTLYQNINGTESELDLEDWDYANSLYALDGDSVVLSLATEDGDRALVPCAVEKDALVLQEPLAEDDYSVDGIREIDGKRALYYFDDLSRDSTYGDLTRYSGGEPEVLAKEASWVYILEDGSIFKLEDLEYDEAQIGSLYAVVDGKDERVADDVYTNWLTFLPKGQILYISDGDLYLWEKEESVRLARNVTQLWASNELDGNSFYCM